MHLEQALKIKLHAAPRERIYMGGLGVFLLQGAALSALGAHYVCVTNARPFALFLARMSYRVSCTLLDLNE
jgi:hypothetical protein